MRSGLNNRGERHGDFNDQGGVDEGGDRKDKMPESACSGVQPIAWNAVQMLRKAPEASTKWDHSVLHVIVTYLEVQATT